MRECQIVGAVESEGGGLNGQRIPCGWWQQKALLEELENAYQEIPDLKYTGHTGEIDDLLSALEKGTRPLITGVDGKRTVEMITAIYKAGFTDQVVKLPILPEDEYYRGDGIQKNAIHFYKKGKALESLSAEEIKVEAVQ